MLFRVVDVETVPDLEVWTPGVKRWSLAPALLPATGMKLAPEEPFPPPQACRVVAVAWCDVEMRDTQVRKVGDVSVKSYEFVECRSLAGWDAPERERDMLQSFRDRMVAAPATLVTWNGRGFDLLVLSMRALRWGVPWGWYYDVEGTRYRYSTTGHVDLMDFLSDYGACRQMKLDDVARLVGLPGKAAGGAPSGGTPSGGTPSGGMPFDGSGVADLVARGVVEENRLKIARYCLQDVLQTALIFLRTRYHLEILDAEGYERSLATFSGSEVVRGAIDVDWEKVRGPELLSREARTLVEVVRGGRRAPRRARRAAPEGQVAGSKAAETPSSTFVKKHT
jgi:hypothetical protein